MSTRPASASPEQPPWVRAERLYDSSVVFIAGVLMTLGVVMVYSASVTVDGAALDWRQWWTSPLKQCGFALVGFLVMLAAAHMDYRVLAWRRRSDGWRSVLLAAFAVALLVGAFLPGLGQETLGARRTIVLYAGPPHVSFQPSEVAKVVLVIWLAALLTRPTGVSGQAARPGAVPRGDPRHFRTSYLPAVLTAALLIGLTAIEDFGTAVLMGTVMLALLLAGGARWSHMGLTVLAALGAAALLVIQSPYRLKRIATFISETPDPAGAGYQVDQGLLAIGSGSWLGRGLGAGVQKYGYLPYDNNDFILAIICEELGVVGGLVVVALFLLLLWRGWRIAATAPDSFGRLLAIGLTLTICLQAAFNIGVVTDSVPTKGISLPFVSAGGSGVVFLGLAVGLLAAVGRRRGPLDDRGSSVGGG